MKHKRLNRDGWGFQYYPYYQMRIDCESFCAKYRPSIWYVDIIDGIEYDDDGIAVFIDKYLDVIFTPEGDIKIDDRDELEQAHDSGELSDVQYEAALAECDLILDELCSDIARTDAWCADIREIVEKRIAAGEAITKCREVLQQSKQ